MQDCYYGVKGNLKENNVHRGSKDNFCVNLERNILNIVLLCVMKFFRGPQMDQKCT